MATRTRYSSKRSKSLWWARWPGAIGLGLISFVMIQMAVIPAALFAAWSSYNSAGTDLTLEAPDGWAKTASAALALSFLILPGLTVWFARRKWLGYLLLALAVSFFVMCWGLVLLGVL